MTQFLCGIATIISLYLLCNIMSAEEPKKPTKVEQALMLLMQGDGGILATINGNSPYVSSTPFTLNKDGNPIIFISDLARHTAYISKNPNVSIIINKPDKDGDYFNGSRVTVNGKMVKVTDEEEIKLCAKSYMSRFKEAQAWADFGDFNYYKLETSEMFMIGGFGEIDYIDLKEFKTLLKK